MEALLAARVGQTRELWMRRANKHWHLVRLLRLRVPEEVAQRRRADLEADAKRRGSPAWKKAWKRADWTILLIDVPANLLSFQEALVLLQECGKRKCSPHCESSRSKWMNGAHRIRGVCSVSGLPGLMGSFSNTDSFFCTPGPRRAAQSGQTGPDRSVIPPVLYWKLTLVIVRFAPPSR